MALIAVVISVLLTAAVPRLNQTAQRLRVEHTAFELAHLLRTAHERAVSFGAATVWVWDAEARTARVEPDASGGGEESPPAIEIISSSTMPEGITIRVTRDSVAVDCGCVRFDPAGTSEPTILTVSMGAQVYTATVDGVTSSVILKVGS